MRTSILEREFSGEMTLKIDGFETEKLIEKLCHTCKVISLYRRADSVFVTFPGRFERKVKKLVEENDCIFEEISRRGLVYFFKKYIKRFGILFGAVISVALIFILSNLAMKIEIVGVDDEDLKSRIYDYLREEGVRPGAYIPGINFLELSQKLFSDFDEIGWCSGGSSGSVVTVNINVATPKPSGQSARIPCNIVSSRDAVIVDASVKVGRLSILIGDAVHKGQLLVSGVIEGGDGITRYLHSLADITGRYEQTAVFNQSFNETSVEKGKTLYRRSLKFFDFEIPLPGELLDSGITYSESYSETPLRLMGLTLPLSLKTTSFTEQKPVERSYNYQDALMELYRKIRNYEHYILKDRKIISREVAELSDETGLKLTVNYILEGPIGEISEIFIK